MQKRSPLSAAGRIQIQTVVVLFCFGLSLCLAGCGYFFGPKAASAPVEIKDGKLACLGELRNDVAAWLSGEERDVESMVDCAMAAMQSFEDSTRGQRADGWSREELEQFLATYVPQVRDVRTSWVGEGLKWKLTLLGGDDGRFSREEFRRIRRLLTKLKPFLSNLTPHLNVLLFRSANADSARVDAAIQALGSVLATLESEFEDVNRSADVSRLSLPLTAIPPASILASGGVGEESGIKAYLGLAEALKSFAVGGDGKVVTPNEWPRVVKAVGHLWTLGLRMRYQIKGNSRAYAEDLHVVEAVIQDATSFLMAAVKSFDCDGVPISKLNALVLEAERRALLPKGLRAATLNAALPTLLSKLLYGNARSDRVLKADTLTTAEVRALASGAKDWLEGQRLLNAAIGGGPSITRGTLVNALRTASPASFEAVRARAQLLEIFSTGRPLIFDDERRLVIGRESVDHARLLRADLERINLVRGVIGVVLRGYTHDARAAEQTLGLTEQEAQEFYVDVRQIGLEIGLVDSRSDTAGLRTFMETNLFLSVSNGDRLIDLHEAVEWFHFVLSGGLLADRIHAELEPICGMKGTADVFDRQKLRSDCFRKHFSKEFKRHLANLPNMVAWYEAGGQERASLVIEYLERAGRAAGFTNDPIDSSDLRALLPVLLYNESLFATHDADSSGILETAELWGAYPIIRPFIGKVAGSIAQNETLQKAIFSYLVVFGKAPNQNILGGGKLIAWAAARTVYDEKADRLDVLKVMASFGMTGREAQRRKIEQFIVQKRADLASFRKALVDGSPTTINEIRVLFQCQPDAFGPLSQVLRTQPEKFVPPVMLGNTAQFIFEVKAEIARDQRLERACLPF